MLQCRSKRRSIGCSLSAAATQVPPLHESGFVGRSWQYVNSPASASSEPQPLRNSQTATIQHVGQPAEGQAGAIFGQTRASQTSNTYSVCTYNVLGDSYVSALLSSLRACLHTSLPACLPVCLPALFSHWSSSVSKLGCISGGMHFWSQTQMCETLLIPQAERHYHKLYNEVPKWCLAWDHRRRLLVDEILHWSPDVVCLQVRARPAQTAILETSSLLWLYHGYPS